MTLRGNIIGGRGGDDTGGGDTGDGGSGFFVSSGAVNGLTFNSWANITGGVGGNGTSAGGGGGHGIAFSAGTLQNVSVTLWGGAITGGRSGNVSLTPDAGSGVEFSAGTITNLTMTSWANITGGNGGFGGNGVEFLSGPASTNLVLTNWANITGGNGGPGAPAGSGIFSDTGHLTINNWGAVNAGTGLTPSSIKITGNNFVINMNGHSTVNGKITASDTVADSNVLNLHYTGVSLLAQAILRASLQAQGVLDGHEHDFTYTIRGNTVVVDPIVVQLSLSSYQQQGITPNQQAVGANLDSLTYNPAPGTPLFDLLNAIDTSGNVPLALDELSPQKYELYREIALAAFNFQALSIDERLNNLRDGSESIDTTAIGGGTDKTTAGFSKDGKNVVVPEKQSMQKQWGFFAAGSGVFGDVDAHDGHADASFTSGGVILGIDGKINDNFVAGLLFNYSHTQADLDAQGSNADIDTYGGGIYGGYHNGPWYGNGLLSYAHSSYDSARTIAFPGFNRIASGSTEGDQFGANLDGGYDFHVTDRVTVGPLIGVQYVHASVDGFNESGAAGANLSVGDQDVDSLRSRIGFRADYHAQLRNNVAVAVEVRAAYQHEFLNDSRNISGQFTGSGLGAFSIKTTKPQRDAALAGIGFNATFRDKWTFFVDYDVQAGQESYLEQSVKAGLKVAF